MRNGRPKERVERRKKGEWKRLRKELRQRRGGSEEVDRREKEINERGF